MAETKTSQWSQAADHGRAAILAIGTANPPNIIQQSSFPDFYFRVTNSEHMIEFKEKFQRICDRTKVTKRHFIWDEAILKRHPCLLTYDSPSFNARQDITVAEMPRLGMAAAAKAIEEWGQPKSRITHLIFVTSSGIDLPGADFHLLQLLALPPTVNRFMFYKQACFAGATALRLAKDVAENNDGARVLVVCAESIAFNFRGPSVADVHSLVSMALFGDGAAAVIVGAKPETGERALFYIASASQAALPESESAIEGPIRETGMMARITKDVPGIIAKNIDRCLEKGLGAFGIRDWNSVFWVAHPGGPAVLDEVVRKLGLRKEKIRASMEVLAEYGNLSSATVLFVLDWMRRRSEEEGKETTGEGLEWGVLLGFGPGITVETVVLRSAPIVGNSA